MSDSDFLADAINGRTNGEILLSLSVPGDSAYHPSAEAFPDNEIPTAKITSFRNWSDTEIFAGTYRDLWVSIPNNLEGTASLLICQDGGGYLDRQGPVRATAVLDSLMHANKIRPTIGVFVMPGAFKGSTKIEARNQRSIEYDSINDTYVRFIDEELLPFVENTLQVKITKDPEERIASGISSGGICAFNMAWQRPDSFGKVISHCGSFTNIRGGHEFPFWVREEPRKPIKIFLTSGEADAEILLGSWPLANKMMADALKFAGYDYHFEFGTGGHNLRHGGALFAKSISWLASSESVARKKIEDKQMLATTLRKIQENLMSAT